MQWLVLAWIVLYSVWVIVRKVQRIRKGNYCSCSECKECSCKCKK